MMTSGTLDKPLDPDASQKDVHPIPEPPLPSQVLEEEGREADIGLFYDTMDDIEEEESESITEPPPKHSPSYWKDQEQSGKACTLRFLSPLEMIQHVIDNIPPAKVEEPFRITPVTITNEIKTKDLFDPELGPPADKYSGDWKNFKEIDHGRWILRGTITDSSEIFQEFNRDRQHVAVSFIALAYVTLYSMAKFNSRSVDDIIIYGDRLHTFTVNQRIKELRANTEVGLSESEATMIARTENLGVANTAKHFCISTDKIKLDVTLDQVQGEINAKDLEDVLDVKRGLESFFHDNKLGILQSRNLLLAVWRKGPIFYMFDSDSRGPNGFTCINGVACITRYLRLEDLVEVFLHNLDKTGDNRFFIHTVAITVDPCPREEVRKKKPKLKQNDQVTSFVPIVPGRYIVRGSISQEDPKFGRRLNAQLAPMAYVALAMTLVHRCMFWTKPIIDEIVTIGDQLYGDTLDSLGFEFNPWEDVLTLDETPTNFKIGSLTADCELRPYDQRGVINVKNSNILNLRQGKYD